MREIREEGTKRGEDENPSFRVIYGTATELFGFGLSCRILGGMLYIVSVFKNRLLEVDNL